jgi:hypothetical protein
MRETTARRVRPDAAPSWTIGASEMALRCTSPSVRVSTVELCMLLCAARRTPGRPKAESGR